MRVFFITVPEVSKGLKRTYHKKLEVFSGELEGDVVTADTIYRYNAAQKEWKESPYGRHEYRKIYNKDKIKSSVPHSSMMFSNNVYTSLGVAQACKLILIEEMGRKYKAELQRLQELFDKNVPDITEPLKEIKENHPEYFI